MTSTSDSRLLRVGLLGCGRIARLIHLPVLTRLPGLEVAAIAEQDGRGREASRSLAPAATLFADHREMIETSALDAVVVCLPPALHAEAAIASFERGLHVYLEKPLATTLEDGRRILRAWRSAGTTGWIGFNFRFHPLVVEMRDALRRGSIGHLVGVRTSFCASRRELPEWKRRRDSGGGALLDLASHQFDLLRFVLDQEIVEVNALIGSLASEADTAAIHLRLSAGTMVEVFTSISAVEEHHMVAVGSDGLLAFDRYHSTCLRFRPSRRGHGKAARVRAAAAWIADAPRALRDALFPPRERSYAHALAAFVAAARGEPSAGPELDAGLESLAVVLAAEQAAGTGRTVAVAGSPS